MATDEGAHTSAIAQRKLEEPQHPAPGEGDRGRNSTGIVLGSLAGLLLLAGAVYYFAGHRAGTEVASGPSSATPTQPAPAERGDKPASTTSSLPASPRPPSPEAVPSQAGPTAPPTSTATSAEPAPPPAMPAQNAATSAAPTTERAAAPAATIREPGATPPASAVVPQPMRDQPAALPDQPATATEARAVLVVQRGPARLRSAPGKTGRVVATLAKGAQLKEVGRSGQWIEVETDAGRGWISAALLAAAAR
jgi:hypothetical protein